MRKLNAKDMASWDKCAQKCLEVLAGAISLAEMAIRLRKDPLVRQGTVEWYSHNDRHQASTVVRTGIAQARVDCGRALDRRPGNTPDARLEAGLEKLEAAENHAEDLRVQRIDDNDKNDNWGADWTNDEFPQWQRLHELMLEAQSIIGSTQRTEQT